MLYETQLAALWLGDTTLIKEVSLVSTGFELVTKRTNKHVFLKEMCLVTQFDRPESPRVPGAIKQRFHKSTLMVAQSGLMTTASTIVRCEWYDCWLTELAAHCSETTERTA